MPSVAREVRPRVVTFTNLFRDQLDRYGEVETVAAIWRASVAALPDDVTLVLNADDPAVAALREQARGPVVFFGLDDVTQATDEIDHAADARWCTKCGAELEYDAVFYGHIGHWRCPSCSNARPTPDVRVTSIEQTAHGPRLSIAGSQLSISIHLAQPGTYNVYNALAAAATATALGLGSGAIGPGLLNATAAFGRQEIFQIDGREVHVILAKNPAGLNQVLRTLPDGELDIALFLNDDIADGRDISWIWDVDFELLAGRGRSVTASGRRARDMALRLKYAGVAAHPRVANNVATALRRAIKETPEDGELYVIPTYTAMLELRNVLGKWAGRGKFWEGNAK